MGTYVYGVTKQKINVDGKPVHLCKFLSKATWSWKDRGSVGERTLNRLKTAWHEQELPDFITVGDVFKVGQEVFDYSKRNHGKVVIFYDVDDCFGRLVGWLAKVGRSWTVVKSKEEIWKGSRWHKDVTDSGSFLHKSWINEEGKFEETYVKISD